MKNWKHSTLKRMTSRAQFLITRQSYWNQSYNMSSIKHWKMVPLAVLCDFQNGFAFKNQDYQDDEDGSYVVFRMGNIARGGGLNRKSSKVFVNKDKALELVRFVLKKGDLVICMTDMKASMALLGHTALI